MNHFEVAHSAAPGLIKVGLLGNPNCGKTTLFNMLTGIRQKVGNWPGVTVERKSALLEAGNSHIELTDLPGTYSLIPQSPDEQIAAGFLAQGGAELVINLVDATNLERSLYLTSQLMEHGLPVVIGLNMMDALATSGRSIDLKRLSHRLGCPVIPLVAKKGKGLTELVEAVLEAGKGLKCSVIPAFADGDARLQWVGELAKDCLRLAPEAQKPSATDRLDQVLLHPWLGLPLFLAAMYLVFFLSINLAAPFIDFIDQVAGAVLVAEAGRWIRHLTGQEWLAILLADGLGGGIQTVLTFIPPIGFLFLCLSFLEDSGYMARAMVILDGAIRKLGLPAKAMVPMIVGFGCSVPALMATRTLEEERDRRLTLAMVPFMSCGAKLPVYAMFGAAFFPWGAQNLVFALYLIGILVGIGTGLILKRLVFTGKPAPLLVELPFYHFPSPWSVLATTWQRLRRFLVEAGQIIVILVTGLTLLNSIGTDLSFGNQNSEKSLLAQVGKGITPVFAGMGISEENWPATVGIFTGIFAKEAIIGTLDSLYTRLEASQTEAEEAPADVVDEVEAALQQLPQGLWKSVTQFSNPLGLDLADLENPEEAAALLEVKTGSFGVMAHYFDGQAGAFAYLLWVLLYAPCVAATAALRRESGSKWTLFTLVYMTGLAWAFSTLTYQVLRFGQHPQTSLVWMLGGFAVLAALAGFLKIYGKRVLAANYQSAPLCGQGGACERCQ